MQLALTNARVARKQRLP